MSVNQSTEQEVSALMMSLADSGIRLKSRSNGPARLLSTLSSLAACV
jgi:hypothetical protein